MSKPVEFLVACHGWSASNWLAHALNLNPEVVCSHSARNVVAEDPHQLDGDRLREQIRGFHRGYVARQDEPLRDLVANIPLSEGIRARGSVHLMRLRDLPVQNDRFGDPGGVFQVANLVRHPVDLVWSGCGQFRDLFRYDINELYWTLHKVLTSAKDFVLDLGHRYDLNLGEFENLAFVGACSVLGSLRRDLDAEPRLADIPWVRWVGEVRMEDVTRDPAALSDLLGRLTNGQLVSDPAWLDAVYRVGEVNRHRTTAERLTPAARFAALEDWQREVLVHYLDLYEIPEAYAAKGYDFSFL